MEMRMCTEIIITTAACNLYLNNIHTFSISIIFKCKVLWNSKMLTKNIPVTKNLFHNLPEKVRP